MSKEEIRLKLLEIARVSSPVINPDVETMIELAKKLEAFIFKP